MKPEELAMFEQTLVNFEKTVLAANEYCDSLNELANEMGKINAQLRVLLSKIS